MEEVPCRTSLATLTSPCFVLCLIWWKQRGAFRLLGEGVDHVHGAVEPSPGKIRRTSVFARKVISISC